MGRGESSIVATGFLLIRNSAQREGGEYALAVAGLQLVFGSRKKGWFIVVALQQVMVGQLSLWSLWPESSAVIERAGPEWA